MRVDNTVFRVNGGLLVLVVAQVPQTSPFIAQKYTDMRSRFFPGSLPLSSHRKGTGVK